MPTKGLPKADGGEVVVDEEDEELNVDLLKKCSIIH